MGEKEPRQVSWPVFMTHHPGLPLHGSPLVFILPQILRQVDLSRPHPSGKGRGGCDGVGISEQIQVLALEPTSLKRGEGLTAGLYRAVEGEMGWRGQRWW
jgi:hypothetical protein